MNCTPDNTTNQAYWEAWADYIRQLEPYSWFATLTFKTDILTYSQENPTITEARYEWVDKTGKYPNGTLIRTHRKVKWENAGKYERTKEYVRKVQEEHSKRMYGRWIRKLNEEVFGRRYRERKLGVLHVYAIEYQKRGVAHLHSLIRSVPTSISRIEFEKKWERMHPNNGYANIYPYDPVKGAAGYISKYILKGGMIHIDGPPGQQRSAEGVYTGVPGEATRKTLDIPRESF